MLYRLAAELLLLLHLSFILFVLFGGLLALWRRWLVWLHLAAAAWAGLIEFGGWICPLTPWEQTLWIQARQAGHGGGYVERLLLSLIYPHWLTPQIQRILGATVLFVNAGIYACVYSILRPFQRKR